MVKLPSETNKVLDTYLIIYTPRPEVGANPQLAKVHFLKSGPTMDGQVPMAIQVALEILNLS